MGEAQPLKRMVQEVKNAAKIPDKTKAPNGSLITNHDARDRKWWLRVSIYAFFVLCGESVATLLGRLYYAKGGHSKWIATLVQIAGFPILLPYYCLSNTTPETNATDHRWPRKSSSTIVLIYVSLGLLNGAVCLFHSIGLSLIPVSAYSLICSAQLSFSAFFSYFLNSEKLTPYITNSIVLLTVSSILLLFDSEFSDPSEDWERNKIFGFFCTVGGSAGYGLVLSLTQFSLQRVIKKESTFSAIMDMTFNVSLVSTFVALVGLFTSGDWRTLRSEMEGFELGTVSYVLTLTWATISWQVFNIGSVGLILEVSSLFSNVISVLSLPIVPVLGVIFFHDRIGGVKVMSMVLAIWGLMSYVYQNYIERMNSKDYEMKRNDIGKIASSQEETNI